MRVFLLTGLAVLADATNAFLVGAPADPTLRIFSPDPAAIRFFLAFILWYRPLFGIRCTYFFFLAGLTLPPLAIAIMPPPRIRLTGFFAEELTFFGFIAILKLPI